MTSHKNSEIHIDVSHSRQPLVKGERLVRYEVNTVMCGCGVFPTPREKKNNPSAWQNAEIEMQTWWAGL
jgi:hypothetical protein